MGVVSYLLEVRETWACSTRLSGKTTSASTVMLQDEWDEQEGS